MNQAILPCGEKEKNRTRTSPNGPTNKVLRASRAVSTVQQTPAGYTAVRLATITSKIVCQLFANCLPFLEITFFSTFQLVISRCDDPRDGSPSENCAKHCTTLHTLVKKPARLLPAEIFDWSCFSQIIPMLPVGNPNLSVFADAPEQMQNTSDSPTQMQHGANLQASV
jgi:hypothetical protein